MQSSQIRLIAIKRGNPKIDKGIGGTYTRQYTTLDHLKTSNPILDLSSNDKECQFGDCSVIENIYITNTNLPFPNKFHIYNITGSIRVVDDVQLNEYNDEFYKAEIERFRALLISIFTEYVKAWNLYKSIIDECYVEACYVDPDYDCGPNDPAPTGAEFTYPDLFINAGPDVDIWWPTWLDLKTQPLDSDITQQGPTHQGCELYREWVITNDDSIELLRVRVEDNSELFPVIERSLIEEKRQFDQNITMTLRVVWPWITLEDSRQVNIKYFASDSIRATEGNCRLLTEELTSKTEECQTLLDEINEKTSRLRILQDRWTRCYLLRLVYENPFDDIRKAIKRRL